MFNVYLMEGKRLDVIDNLIGTSLIIISLAREEEEEASPLIIRDPFESLGG